MIRRITLENYMSHRRTVIEPAEGLTVLIGPNNCGKSAVVSALQTVCGEHDGEFMVRHGERIARVTVETTDDDGTPHVITWQRKGKVPSYTIDGVDVHRVGRGNLPDDLHRLLKMPLIESADERASFNVHLGLQKEPIFLINRERDTASFFSSSSDAEKLLEMQKRHRANTQAARSEVKTVDAELQRLDAQLEALEPLNALSTAMEDVEVDYRRLMTGEAAIRELASAIDRLAAAARSVTVCGARSKALGRLAEPPTLQNEPALAALVAKSAAAADRIAAERDRTSALDGLAAPPALSDEGPMQRLVRMVDTLQQQATRTQTKLAALEDLQDPPAAADLTPLRRLGVALSQAARDCDYARTVQDALAELIDPPVLFAEEPLEQAVGRLSLAAALVGRSAAAADRAESDLINVERDIVRFVTQNPLCPTCGGVMSPDHLLHTEVADA